MLKTVKMNDQRVDVKHFIDEKHFANNEALLNSLIHSELIAVCQLPTEHCSYHCRHCTGQGTLECVPLLQGPGRPAEDFGQNE